MFNAQKRFKIRVQTEIVAYPITFIIAMIMVGVLKSNNLDGLIFRDFNCHQIDTYLQFDQCFDSITFKGNKLEFLDHYKNPYFHFRIGNDETYSNDHNTNVATTFGKKYKITDYDEAKRCLPNNHINHKEKTITTKVIWFSGFEEPTTFMSMFDDPEWCIKSSFINRYDKSEQRSIFGPIKYLWLGVIIIPLLSLLRGYLLLFIIDIHEFYPSLWNFISYLAKGLYTYWFYTSVITYRDYCVYEDDYLRCGLNSKISKSVLILMNLEEFHKVNIFMTCAVILSVAHLLYVLPLTAFVFIALIRVRFSIFIQLFNFSFFPVFNIFTQDLYQNLITPLGSFYSPNLWILIQELIISIFVLLELYLLAFKPENIIPKEQNNNHQQDTDEEGGIEISSTRI